MKKKENAWWFVLLVRVFYPKSLSTLSSVHTQPRARVRVSTMCSLVGVHPSVVGGAGRAGIARRRRHGARTPSPSSHPSPSSVFLRRLRRARKEKNGADARRDGDGDVGGLGARPLDCRHTPTGK
jgi:hypothetical protein